MKPEDEKTRGGKPTLVVLIAPCQGFSKANRFGGKDDKKNNDLSLELLEAMKTLHPVVSTFENVPQGKIHNKQSGWKLSCGMLPKQLSWCQPELIILSQHG